jgi:hypothetical protein
MYKILIGNKKKITTQAAAEASSVKINAFFIEKTYTCHKIDHLMEK